MNLKIELAVKQDPENDAVIISKKLLREILDKDPDMTKNGFRVLIYLLANFDSVEYTRWYKKNTADKLGYDKSVIAKGIADVKKRGYIIADPERRAYYKFKSYES